MGLRGEKPLYNRLSYVKAVLSICSLHHKLWVLYTPFRGKTIYWPFYRIFAHAFPSLFALGVYVYAMLVWVDDMLASFVHVSLFILL
jgi:hypothetical protein